MHIFKICYNFWLSLHKFTNHDWRSKRNIKDFHNISFPNFQSKQHTYYATTDANHCKFFFHINIWYFYDKSLTWGLPRKISTVSRLKLAFTASRGSLPLSSRKVFLTVFLLEHLHTTNKVSAKEKVYVEHVQIKCF